MVLPREREADHKKVSLRGLTLFGIEYGEVQSKDSIKNSRDFGSKRLRGETGLPGTIIQSINQLEGYNRNQERRLP